MAESELNEHDDEILGASLWHGSRLSRFLPHSRLRRQNTIKLGASVQLSGPLANTGRYYRDAYKLAVDTINDKGGVTVGGQKYKLALQLLDNQSDVNLSVRQYVQLVAGDKVNFLLGPFASNFALDDSSVAEKYQIPMVQGGGASTQIYSRGYKYIFGTLPAADDYFASTIEMLGKLDPKVKTVALLSADDSFDVSVAKGTRELLAKAGMKLVFNAKLSRERFRLFLALDRDQSGSARCDLPRGP